MDFSIRSTYLKIMVCFAVLVSHSGTRLQAHWISDLYEHSLTIFNQYKSLFCATGIAVGAMAAACYWYKASAKQDMHDIHVGIFFKDALQFNLSCIQKKVKESARRNNAFLDVRSVNSNGVHITLENVLNVLEKDVSRCMECIQDVLSRYVHNRVSLGNAQIELLNNHWCVLSLSQHDNVWLQSLVSDIKSALQEQGFIGLPYIFKPHISLGVLKATEDSDLKWLHSFSVARQLPSHVPVHNITISQRLSQKRCTNNKLLYSLGA